MKPSKKDIVSIKDYQRDEIEHILHTTEIFDSANDFSQLLQHHIVGTMFIEASTRTQLSFLTAAKRLGAQVLQFPASLSSLDKKGESLADTLQIIQNYVDILVFRHPQDGAARFAADTMSIPVINAGDGSNQHPTQTFLDLYTIRKYFSTLDNLHIAFVGDLRFGRTVHSLIEALLNFTPHFYLFSPKNLALPQQYHTILDAHKVPCTKVDSFEAMLEKIDVLYMTRFQRERFADDEEFDFIEQKYSISLPQLKQFANKKLIVMHPLPRGKEVHTDVDNSRYCGYFEQAKNGIPTRQALLALALKKVARLV